jgi:hypothetical protein
MKAGTQMWLGIMRNGAFWQWMNGKRAGYSNWASGEPKKGNDCGVIESNMTWYSVGCDVNAMVKCQKGKKGVYSLPLCKKSFKNP